MRPNGLSCRTTSNKEALQSALSRLARVLIVLALVLSFAQESTIGVQAASEITLAGKELLGRPTDSSITITIVPDSTIEYYYEYGTSSGVYTGQTGTATATGR